ncbi:hypothetical protein HER15_11890 [Tenacibaculum mesophilum]|uniref:Uncharacterized protein n=1 Tax=Tenacibaculum mesophilum TaxID=104268 RepID=A0AAE9MS92_9FLAO|nr:hypothetical protein [Tenacibaculum mesophilum]UTD16880.1 hypothetical protein HER15_11890 [Tenacibaculum mesophilum]
MNLLQEALEFEKNYKSFKTRNEIILSINEVYKKSKDKKLMDVMKRITTVKQKVEKRLKGRL